MSTRSSIWSDEHKHIYIELLDNTVHIEHGESSILVDVEIMPFEKWVALGFPDKRVSEPSEHIHHWVASTNLGEVAACFICGAVMRKE